MCKNGIGGYLELEKNRGTLFHNGAWTLNSGRSCLEWVIIEKKIKTIALPYFICDVVSEVCKKHRLKILRYHIDSNLQPADLPDDSVYWLYLVNYYGTLKPETISKYQRRADIDAHDNGLIQGVIVDNTQAFYDIPVDEAYILYTCRKYFGVPDGAFLYARDLGGYEEFELDKSAEYVGHLLGRFEGDASDYYEVFKGNDERLRYTGIKRMSRLTENLLRGIDYEYVKKRRTENYRYLSEKLDNLNKLNAEHLHNIEGAFAYPLWIDDGDSFRQKLIAEKIYVPILWPNTLKETDSSSLEFDLAQNILPLPCDQRYGIDEMRRICEVIER